MPGADQLAGRSFPKSIAESAGLRVNDLYDVRFVTEQDEADVDDGVIPSSAKEEVLLGRRKSRVEGSAV